MYLVLLQFLRPRELMRHSIPILENFLFSYYQLWSCQVRWRRRARRNSSSRSGGNRTNPPTRTSSRCTLPIGYLPCGPTHSSRSLCDLQWAKQVKEIGFSDAISISVLAIPKYSCNHVMVYARKAVLMKFVVWKALDLISFLCQHEVRCCKCDFTLR